MKGEKMLIFSYEDVETLRELAETSLWNDSHCQSIKKLSDDAWIVAEILYVFHKEGNIESIPDSQYKKLAITLIARFAQSKAV